MQFHQMLYVVEAARAGSINKAAAKLFLAQSSISSAIAELEEELDISIFTRSNHGVALTDAGKELVRYITPILEQKQRVETFYRQKLAPPPSHFSVSTQRYPFSLAAFADFIAQKNAAYYVYRIRETDMYVAIEDVYADRADVGVLFLSAATEGFVGKMLAGRNLEFSPLRDVAAQIFIGKGHPLADRDEISLAEITSYPFLTYGSESSLAGNFSEEVELLAFKDIGRTVYISDRGSAYNLLANSDAFSLGSGLLYPGYVDERILAKPIRGTQVRMTLGYIKKKDRPTTGDLALFIACLTEALAAICPAE